MKPELITGVFLLIMQIDNKGRGGRLKFEPLVFCTRTISLRNTQRRRAAFGKNSTGEIVVWPCMQEVLVVMNNIIGI
jgi:hypothetical protein